jgi:carboxyl-terminal processing protease
MRSRRLLTVLLVVLAFVAGFGLATLLATVGGSAGAKGQARLYRQVLQDLQSDYYRPVDATRLGQAGVNGLLASLRDPYTVYFTRQQAAAFDQELSGTYTGIGTELDSSHGKLTITRVFAGSPAARAGVRSGDVIVAVDGTSTAGHSVNDVVSRILGRAGTKVELRLRRGTSVIDLTLTRGTITRPLTVARLIADHGTKVGYVALSAFASGAGSQVASDVAKLRAQGAQALVFDLRDNGGGLVEEAVKVASDFLPPGRVVATEKGLHVPTTILKTVAGHATSLPLVVLVNGDTASASEIVTGALQDHGRATVIGTRTFGKGVVQTVLPLPAGASLKITIAAYLTPDGRNINHKGLQPDIVVAQPAGATADRALERALRFFAAGR